MNYDELIDLLVESFKTGVPKNITADKLREALIKVVEFANITRGDYQGTATPSTNPGTPSTPVYYFAGQSGTYTNFGGISVTASEGINILSYSGSSWSKAVIPISLIDVLKDVDLNFSPNNIGKNKIDLSRLIFNRFVNTNGAVDVNNSANSIIGQKVTPSTTYTISGIVADSLKKLVVRDSSGGVLLARDFAAVPLTFSVPSTGATIDFTPYREASGGTINLLQLEAGSSATSYEPPKKGISQLKGNLIEAARLSAGNEVPNPISDLNAVNLGYFKNFGISLEDLTMEEVVSKKNLLNPDYLQVGIGLDSSGNPIASGSGRSIIGLPVEGSTTYTLSGIHPDTLKKLAYFDENGNRIGSTSSLDTMPHIRTSPSAAKTVNIALRRNSNDPEDVLSVAQFEKGSEATAFEPYKSALITAIKGIKLFSSEAEGPDIPPSSFDQSLNTFNNVEFNSIQAGAFKTNLPEGAGTPPPGVQIGDAWVDTTNDTIKVRRL